MLDNINLLKEELQNIAPFENTTDIEAFRLKYLSKKGIISKLFNDFKNLPPDNKRTLGKPLNELKTFAQGILDNALVNVKSAQTVSHVDYTMSPEPLNLGNRHPLSVVRNKIVDIFATIGFTVYEGPEIEDDWHVFTGLNFPLDHPARDMQDTFFINKQPDILLRTHTSSVQIRAMETNQPPLRKIFPGRVFRNEAISARSHCIFHQVEGLYIDENVSFADFKQTLLHFSREMFGSDTKIRLRPSFFPFTEPSAELDISCTICGGKGCNICKYSGWVEIMGCGMVDPNVLESTNISSVKYTGFAFGMGIERIAMLLYQVNDIRLFFENDIRFISQFNSIVS